jgi:hypothetical protein
MADNEDDVRVQLLEALMDKVEADPYPSSTMLDIIESLLRRPDDVEAYAELLLSRIREDTFPSLSLIQRVNNFV